MPTALLPIFKAGAIIEYAIIDEEDYDRLVAFANWKLLPKGYVHSGPKGSRSAGPRYDHMLHRFIMGCVKDDGIQVDHRDRNKLNNTKANLRLVTRSQNAQNLPSCMNTSSQYRGVSFNAERGKWRAGAKLNGKSYNLGNFATELEAAEAARVWRTLNMPYAID